MDGWRRRSARRVALHAGPDLDLGGLNGVAPEAPPGLWEGGGGRILPWSRSPRAAGGERDQGSIQDTAATPFPEARWGLRRNAV